MKTNGAREIHSSTDGRMYDTVSPVSTPDMAAVILAGNIAGRLPRILTCSIHTFLLACNLSVLFYQMLLLISGIRE
jgi:hypothetical protein